jgi:hypothetical protein
MRKEIVVSEFKGLDQSLDPLWIDKDAFQEGFNFNSDSGAVEKRKGFSKSHGTSLGGGNPIRFSRLFIPKNGDPSFFAMVGGTIHSFPMISPLAHRNEIIARLKSAGASIPGGLGKMGVGGFGGDAAGQPFDGPMTPEKLESIRLGIETAANSGYFTQYGNTTAITSLSDLLNIAIGQPDWTNASSRSNAPIDEVEAFKAIKTLSHRNISSTSFTPEPPGQGYTKTANSTSPANSWAAMLASTPSFSGNLFGYLITRFDIVPISTSRIVRMGYSGPDAEGGYIEVSSGQIVLSWANSSNQVDDVETGNSFLVELLRMPAAMGSASNWSSVGTLVETFTVPTPGAGSATISIPAGFNPGGNFIIRIKDDTVYPGSPSDNRTSSQSLTSPSIQISYNSSIKVNPSIAPCYKAYGRIS